MPQFQTKEFRLAALLSGILAVLIFNSWFLYSSFQKVNEQENLVIHTNTILNELDLTLSAVKDAETGIRGFLLTEREEYLEPYRSGVVDARDHLARVKTLTADHPLQQDAVATLSMVIDQRFHVLQRLLDEVRAGGKRETNERNLYFSEGKTIMDALRAQVDKMKTTERRLLAERSVQAERGQYFFIWSLVLTTVLSVGVVSGSFFQFRRNQVRAALEVQEKSRQAWIREHIAELAALTAGDVGLEEISRAVLGFMSRRFHILASKLFVVEGGRPLLGSAFGVDKDEKRGGFSVNGREVGNHLVAEALSRNSVWQVNSVPEDYWKVSSALGESRPRSLVFLPFRFQGKNIGVIEMAAFEELSQDQLDLLGKLVETIAIGINAAQSRERLQMLLEQTQLQAEELQAQQEELKANNEELEQQARALESQQQAMNIKNQELEATRRELEMKALDLQRSSQYKSEFLAKMSHELRTPLNGLLILSTLLVENKERNLTEQQKQFARSIQSAGNDLLILINDILDLSKIEAKKLTLRPEEFFVGSFVDMMFKTFEPQAAARDLELKLDVPEAIQTQRLFTDRQRLEQVLRNFLSNAMKFTEKGSITIRAELQEQGRFIDFAIIDTGIGVPAEKQAVIFEAFEQADGSVSRKYGGTGLGLTISRELSHLLGGEISLKSAEGEGSEFSVRIPVELNSRAQSAAAMPKETERGSSKSAPLSTPVVVGDDTTLRVATEVRKALGSVTGGKTILIVEDDSKFRASVVEATRAYGFQPIEASDGEVALAILNEHTPDAILLDIKLPGISGLGILEMIKQMPHLRHIPIHMISALDYQHNALRMGALGYLTKPVTMEKVRSALSRIENLISQKLRRVLLIEDDERQSQAISELVAGADVEVVSAKTGKKAVEKLRSCAFDCIILDLTLPDVSGFELLSELNQLEISLPPIVIYTGKDLTSNEEEHLRRYSESIIIKGARSPERLLDEVNLFLHRVESLLPLEKREMLNHMRSQEQSFVGKTILLVDDDLRNVFALTSALEAKGLAVRIAKNGIEALESLERHSDIDLVLMDIMMPKMDGYEAMRRIRSHDNERVRRLPVVALTAKAMKEDHEKCMEAGATDYLPKPVSLDNLTTVMKVWLSPKGLFA